MSNTTHHLGMKSQAQRTDGLRNLRFNSTKIYININMETIWNSLSSPVMWTQWISLFAWKFVTNQTQTDVKKILPTFGNLWEKPKSSKVINDNVIEKTNLSFKQDLSHIFDTSEEISYKVYEK